MTIKNKKIFITFNPGSGQSLFYRLWQFTRGEPRATEEFGPAIENVAAELALYAEQMRRQQVHVDEIKRLCHVPVD